MRYPLPHLSGPRAASHDAVTRQPKALRSFCFWATPGYAQSPLLVGSGVSEGAIRGARRAPYLAQGAADSVCPEQTPASFCLRNCLDLPTPPPWLSALRPVPLDPEGTPRVRNHRHQWRVWREGGVQGRAARGGAGGSRPGAPSARDYCQGPIHQRRPDCPPPLPAPDRISRASAARGGPQEQGDQPEAASHPSPLPCPHTGAGGTLRPKSDLVTESKDRNTPVGHREE